MFGQPKYPGQPDKANPTMAHPTMDQLRKLRLVYKREMDAIEELWETSSEMYGKSYSILSI